MTRLERRSSTMESRRKSRGFLPHRITLWVGVCCIIAIGLLDNRPVDVDVDIPSADPVELTRDSESDVVIVLDYQAIKSSPDKFSKKDFSAAWINLFEQEIGPVTIATPGSLSQKMLDKAQVLVLTSSASDVPESLVKRLRERVLDNRMLLVQERPKGELRDRFGANAKVGSQGADGFTFARDLPEPFNRQLLATPLSTEYLGSTTARERSETLLSIDGAPVIYAEKIGKGTIITIDFDLGEALVSLQQGKPSDDFSVHPKGEWPKTSDLVLNETLNGSDVPFADLLERFIVHGVVGRYRPLPAFWLFPNGADGAVIPIHPDDALGDKATWMLRHEVTHKATSTLLTTFDAGMTASEAAVANRLGGELGLIWRVENSPSARLESFGVGALQPFARAASLENQFQAVVETSPSEALFTGMTHERWWSDDWSAPFRALVTKRVRTDVSYASESRGYSFGTGLPYLALDNSGLPLSIREQPVILPERATTGPELEELLEKSRGGHHQAIGWSLSPSSFSSLPEMQRFDAWVDSFEAAKRHNHSIMSVRRLDVFLRSRRAGVITSQIVIENQPDQPESRILRITAEAKRRGMHLMVPKNIFNKPLYKVRRAANRVGDELVSGEIEVRDVSYVGYPMALIPLDSGFNSIDVVYR